MRVIRSRVSIGAMDRESLMRLAFDLARGNGLNPAAAQAAAAIGWFESYYGTRKPFLLPDGRPSWNWGATTARAGIPSFGGGDKDASGNPITQRWARWDSMAEGFDYWVQGFGSVRAALPFFAAGDAIAGAAQLYDRGYFTGVEGTREDRIRAYARAIVDTAAQVAAATGTPLLLTRDQPVPPRATGPAPAYQAPRGAGLGPVGIAFGVGALYLAWKVTR